MTDLDRQIEQVSARRQAVWAGAPEAFTQEAVKLGSQLADLYELRRQERASGDRNRGDIVRQARVESELERLITR